MTTSKFLVYGLVALFSLSVLADDGEFGAEPPATMPSAEGEYNKDLVDAVGNEEPKVPQPERNKVKPAVKKDSSALKPKKKDKKAGKKDKAAKKGKKSGKKADKKARKKSPQLGGH